MKKAPGCFQPIKSVIFHFYQYCDELTKTKQVTEKELYPTK